MEGTNFSQGISYSCQTLASIGAIARNAIGQNKLQEICKSTADGIEIKFGRYPHIQLKVTNKELIECSDELCNEREQDFNQRIERVKEILPPEQFFWVLPRFRPRHVSGDKLVRVLELAYAKLMLTLHPSTYPELTSDTCDSLLVYRHKNFHYDPARVIGDITNWPVSTLIANGGTDFNTSKSFAEENKKDGIASNRALLELAKISDHFEKYIVVVSSVGVLNGSFVYLDSGSLITPFHDFAVKSIDQKNKNICLMDPYSSRIGLVLNYEDFLQYYNMITVATVQE